MQHNTNFSSSARIITEEPYIQSSLIEPKSWYWYDEKWFTETELPIKGLNILYKHWTHMDCGVMFYYNYHIRC